ncbi:RNA-directed DNA polymerase-like protein [Gossypium australe]|uniref:RNA-directed DNA polymerase-like protein n=1 Tax=Gossypium australe TaxID=47621 RepID=A0A5B6UUM7_9ROSI|nr:RNA-directed DNA polymerase-like protein [Gossypium australe]
MHKILLEDCHDNSIEQQRRMNPIMKEVVKNEIIQWLDCNSPFWGKIETVVLEPQIRVYIMIVN